jgi:hypothetical protein
MTDAEVTANIGRNLGNAANPQQAVQELMQTTVATNQPGGMSPDMRRFTGATGLTGLAESVGMGYIDPRLDTGLPGNNAFLFENIPFVGSIENPNFGYSMFGGTASIGVDMSSLDWGAGQAFLQGVQEATRMGTTSREALGQAGYEYMRLQGYGASYIATGRRDGRRHRATSTRGRMAPSRHRADPGHQPDRRRHGRHRERLPCRRP